MMASIPVELPLKLLSSRLWETGLNDTAVLPIHSPEPTKLFPDEVASHRRARWE